MRTQQDQIALEREMITLGCDRVNFLTNRQKKKRQESLSKWGEALSTYGVDQITIHIRAVRKRIQSGKAGISFAQLLPITHLPPQQVAAASIRTVIDSLSSCPTLHSVSMDVADKLWIETMLDRATTQELLKFKRGRSRQAHKMAAIRRMERTDNWTAKEKIASGLFLVQLIAKETGLIEIVREDLPHKKQRVVKATEQCMKWINDVKEMQELMTPNYLPMLIPPRDWTSPKEGGYYSKLPLKLFKSNNEIIEANCTGKEPVYQAANIHQSIGWKINEWMLEQIEHASDNNLEVGALLPREGWPIPPYPKHLDENDLGVLNWRRKAKILHEKNERTRNKRIANAKILWIARRFKDEDQIYFPMSLDFRGRFYYRPPYLNPQGNDISRSLLLFANAKPINTEEDLNWLRIHGANLYGLKSDWQTRIDWVIEREQLITGAGNDPWSNAEFWMRADKPWSFLAFCREYHLFRSQGYGYQCALPVMLDCTCSGIQHFSGLLRNKEMGSMVNIAPSDKPQDIYGTVITKVNEALRDSTDDRARKWLMLQPDRSLAKPCVMTTPYAASRTAFYYYAYEWAQKRAKDLFGNGSWTVQKGCMTTMHFMANILHREATKIISPAVAAMKYFKAIGLRAGKEDQPLQWRSPSGLLVQQQYQNQRESRIRLRYLSDISLDIRTAVETPGLDNTRMANALSANILHSFDSSHMAMASILAIKKDPTTNIGGVHDCFATTPSEMSKLRDSVRQSFADLYQTDWLTQIKLQLESQIKNTEDLPPKPELGDLDPSITRTSNYFIT